MSTPHTTPSYRVRSTALTARLQLIVSPLLSSPQALLPRRSEAETPSEAEGSEVEGRLEGCSSPELIHA